MSLTREQFMAGAIFQKIGIDYYRFQFVPDPSPSNDHAGMIRIITGSRFTWTDHHCNVVKITSKGFKVYTSLLGTCVYGWRYFDRMLFISDDPEKKVD